MYTVKVRGGIHEKSALRRYSSERALEAALQVSVGQTCRHGIELWLNIALYSILRTASTHTIHSPASVKLAASSHVMFSIIAAHLGYGDIS